MLKKGKPLDPPKVLFHPVGILEAEEVHARGLQGPVKLYKYEKRAEAAWQGLGECIALLVLVGQMMDKGYSFTPDELDQTWTTESIPPEYIFFPGW